MGRRRNPEEARAAILEAALDLFQTVGMERTGLREIAAKARISKSTVFRFFGGKDDLFVQAGHHFLRQYRLGLERLREEAKEDPAGALERYLDGLADSVANNPRRSVLLSRMLFETRVIPARASAELRKAFLDIMEPPVDLLSCIVKEGVARGIFRPVLDAEHLPFLIYAMTRTTALALLLPDVASAAGDVPAFVKRRIFALLGAGTDGGPEAPHEIKR